MRIVRFALLGALLGASACTNPELEQKINDLEKKVADLEKSAKEGPAKGGKGAPQGNPEEEQAAGNLLKEASELAEKLDYDGAKGKIAELKTKYGSSRAARAAERLETEISIIGKDAGAWQTEKWFQGKEPSMASGTTLLVFWEVWCPHCKREVPKLQATYEKYQGKGLNMVGLTKMTRDIKEEDVTKFLSENKVGYPIAKEKGEDMSNQFAVRGIPAAAVVKDGKIVWRGHPARLTDQMIEGWL